MVDADRLSRILSRVVQDVAELRAARLDERMLADDLRLSGVKYKFVTAIEGCVRAAQHLLASERLGVPDSNAAAIRMLSTGGVLPVDLALRVSRAVGFRNVLVHEYAEVDDARVLANLALLDDLEEFCASLAGWVAQQ